MSTHAEVAKHLFLSRQAVGEMVANGELPGGGGRGQLDLDACREAYIKRLRAVASGHVSADGELDLTAERARLAKEQADRLEMANAQQRRELLARADVDAAVEGAFARVRAKMLGVPSKMAGELAAEDEPVRVQAVLQSAIYEALAELASTDVVALCGDGDPGEIEAE